MDLRRSIIGGVGMLGLATLVVGFWGDTPMLAGQPQTGIGRLFADAPQRAARGAAADRTTIRSRRVAIDAAALVDPDIVDVRMAARGSLLLNLFDDTSFWAVRDRIDQASDGFTWVGHIPGIELSTVTLASVDGAISGSIVMPDAVYSIRFVGGGVHEVAQVDQSKFPPELDPIVATTADAGIPAAADVVDPTVALDDGSTIDVMVLYTAAAEAKAGGAAAMATRVNLGISEANTSFLNSGVAQRLRLVNSQQVDHSENNDLAQDLYAVSNRNGSTAVGDSAASLRNTYGADLVVLVTSPASPNGCGIAWLMSSVSSGFAPYGFSVVEQSCISPNFSFAHELGHNMGARHDWYVDNDITPYTYAHGYVDPQNRFRSVMAYNDACSSQGFTCRRLLYWSNPAVGYGSAPMGIPGGTKSDCPKGDASNISCDADDHRALNNTALTVANFRQSLGGGRQTPLITWANPASVAAGTALSATQLNATATVNGTTVAGTFVYSPAAGIVLTAGTLTLSGTFTPTNTAAYATASKAVTIVVTAGSGGGTFVGPGNGGPATGLVIADLTLVYNGAAYPVVSGKVTFPDCTVYIAMTSGLLIPAGMAPGCTPGGGGTTQTTPVITWANPASVVAGTVLGATQLNATANVPGTFVYTPAAGTALTAGTQPLSTTFTPTNTASYTTAARTVSIVVTASGGGGTFQGPGTGGPATGSVSGTTLTYNGATYVIVNGKVTFPDCTVYIAMDSGLLIPAGMAPGCAPGGGGSGGGGFVGPGTGGPATGTVNASETQLAYNGATYPIVNGKVTFPDCTVYIALRSGLLIPAGMAPGCTPGDR